MIARTRAGVAVLALGLPLLAACSSSSPHPSTAARAHAYMAIATPANHALEESFDALEDEDDDVATSATLLRNIAATERRFDHDLLALKLPADLGATVLALVKVNEGRADRTEQAASASSLASLHRYETELDAMNGPVEDQVGVLRKELGLPPPDTD